MNLDPLVYSSEISNFLILWSLLIIETQTCNTVRDHKRANEQGRARPLINPGRERPTRPIIPVVCQNGWHHTQDASYTRARTTSHGKIWNRKTKKRGKKTCAVTSFATTELLEGITQHLVRLELAGICSLIHGTILQRERNERLQQKANSKMSALPEEEPPSRERLRDVKKTNERFLFRTTCALPQPDDATLSAGGASALSNDVLLAAAEHTRLGRQLVVDEGGQPLSRPNHNNTTFLTPNSCTTATTTTTSPITPQHSKAIGFKEADSFYGGSSWSHSLDSGSHSGWGLKIEFPGRLSGGDDVARNVAARHNNCDSIDLSTEDAEETITRATDTRTTTSAAHHSRAAWSALTGDGGTVSTSSFWIEGDARKVIILVSGLLIFLIVCSLVLAGLCGAGFCTQGRGAPTNNVDPSSVLPLIVTTKDLYAAVDTFMSNPLAIAPINDWDVSNISDFSRVFDATRNQAAARFQTDLTGWDTSLAVNMDRMFYGAEAFNGDISEFQTGQVTSMESMFSNAQSFNGYLGSWDVSKVVNANSMFLNAFSFQGEGLEFWNTILVEDMSHMVRRYHKS